MPEHFRAATTRDRVSGSLPWEVLMPTVVVHRPGHSTGYTYHDPDTGVDTEMVDWTFNATVNGRLGIVNGAFPLGTSESSAASWLWNELTHHPEHLTRLRL
jgi:hypothetical protein